jgi:hypothetical protein
MDFMKVETDADDETGMASAGNYRDRTDIKELEDPVLITLPSLKSESEVSCVILVRNISQI